MAFGVEALNIISNSCIEGLAMFRKIAQLKSILLLLFISPTILAGNSPNNEFSSVEMEKIKAGSKVLLMPLNTNQLLKEFEIEPVENALKDQLKNYKLFVSVAKMPTQADRLQYMLLTAQQNADREGALEAKSIYAGNIGENFSLVLFPSVIVRVEEMSGRFIDVDGVSLNIPVSGGSIGVGMWSGNQWVYSIKLEVFAPDGRWLMTTYGGISMPKYADGRSHQFLRKDNIFEEKKDRKNMEKGIKTALKPAIKKIGMKR